MKYPADWPRCVCGDPCMDGKATCGRVECGPSTRRMDAYGNKYEVTADEAARLDRIRAELFQSGDGYGGEQM